MQSVCIEYVLLEFATLYGVLANLHVYRNQTIKLLQSGLVQNSNSLQTITTPKSKRYSKQTHKQTLYQFATNPVNATCMPLSFCAVFTGK